MGYLVYCTTCNGTMSNNAGTCPHCGESGFTRHVEDVGYETCRWCNGKGETTSSNGLTSRCGECTDGKTRYVKSTKIIDSRRRV